MPQVNAISISDRKGMRKKNIDSVVLIENFGLENDAHGGRWHRQVSLLAEESIEQMRQKGLDVVAGNFAENITTVGIDLCTLEVGTHIRIGVTELIISQLGKVCHHPCAIYHQAGDCVMPREGIFGVVIRGGRITVGDPIEVLSASSTSLAIIGTADSEKDYGEQLNELARRKWQPGVIRFDKLKTAENNLQTILDDLMVNQRVDRIILFDPSGALALAFAGKAPSTTTSLHYCRTLDEVEALA